MTDATRRVLHSSVRTDWGTPRELFDALNSQYNFTLDLCASAENALCEHWSDNCFSVNYENEVFFCNPPYGREIKDILASIPATACGILLLPSRTGSGWFHETQKKASWTFFLRGRVKFVGARHSAPFDSVLIGMNLDYPQNLQGLLCWRGEHIGGKDGIY